MSRDPVQQQIQIARRQLGLDDETYRQLLERVTGKRSSKGMTAGERSRVLEVLKRQGFRPTGKRRPTEHRADLRYVFVLWRLLAELGAVEAGTAALNAFIGSDNFRMKWGEQPTDVRFLSLERASDVIEALKAMCWRHGVDPRP